MVVRCNREYLGHGGGVLEETEDGHKHLHNLERGDVSSSSFLWQDMEDDARITCCTCMFSIHREMQPLLCK